MQSSLSHLEIAFTISQCQDVIRSKPGFALAEGIWSNWDLRSVTLLKEDSMVDLPT